MKAPKVKVAVSLSPDVVDRLRDAVAGGAADSVSAYVEHALRGQLAAEADFDGMVAEMLDATGGAITEPERAAAARLLGSPAA